MPRKKYDLFISYAGQDSELARDVAWNLKNSRSPLGPVRVFLPEAEVPIGSNLNAEFARALSESDYLLVLCSPEAPKSKWVESEINYFLNQKEGAQESILVAVSKGNPDEDIFPEAIREIANQKKWLDLRDLEPFEYRFQDKVTDLVASVQNVPAEKLRNAISRAKKSGLLAKAGVGLLLLASVAWLSTFLKSNDKEERETQEFTIQLYRKPSENGGETLQVVPRVEINSELIYPNQISLDESFEVALRSEVESVEFIRVRSDTSEFVEIVDEKQMDPQKIKVAQAALIRERLLVSLPLAGMEVRPEEEKEIGAKDNFWWSLKPKTSGDFSSRVMVKPKSDQVNFTLLPPENTRIKVSVSSSISIITLVSMMGGVLGALLASLPAWIGLIDKRRLKKESEKQRRIIMPAQ